MPNKYLPHFVAVCALLQLPLAATPLVSMQSPLNLAVLGLSNTSIINSNVTIHGNEGVYTGGSINNMAPSTVTGNVYVTSAGQCSNGCGPGNVNGSVLVDPADLATAVTNALLNASTAASLTATQTFGAINAPLTITGNGGLNVIAINGDIKKSITLSGNANDIFILNVAGTLTLTGSSTLNTGGNVTADHVLYNFTGASGDISTHVGNVVYGTLLAPTYSFNSIDGVFYGELIGSGTMNLMSGAEITSQPFNYTAAEPTYSPVPEPSTLSFLTAGAVLFAGRTFFRRQSAR